ncbi:MAG: nucleotidyl transferase AbiEii/AbiGii toxin family protein [Deltaproteobacteria bacterium]|nr:nucleotidyl transferase AbiEii/AbiGii toxin family protein [Deltaproteobacteria bacterium]MBW2418348.1 nucleotidyl transferase AbiEii/AbiGii toxin family protein [Deltaproteobacteria bacterium]
MLFDEKIVAIEQALQGADIPHAFGGANALAYYGTPRATADIDVNIFVPATRGHEVLAVLGALGVSADDPALPERIERDGQARVFWQKTPIDLFFSYDALHESSMARRRVVDFGGDPIHVLSPEDLMTYKVVFNREKDWRDIAEMVYAANEALDFDYVREWLERILEQGDPQLQRLQKIIDSGGTDLGP